LPPKLTSVGSARKRSVILREAGRGKSMGSPVYDRNDDSCDEPYYNKHAMTKLSGCFQ
jgi:hypothetical protein